MTRMVREKVQSFSIPHLGRQIKPESTFGGCTTLWPFGTSHRAQPTFGACTTVWRSDVEWLRCFFLAESTVSDAAALRERRVSASAFRVAPSPAVSSASSARLSGCRRLHAVEEPLRRASRHVLSAAVAENASSADLDSSPIDEIVKYLTQLGWEKAWIDGVTERIAKKQLITTPDTVKAACAYLLELGISEGQLCNMVSLCFTILGYGVEDHLKPVVEYLRKKGVTNLSKLLTMQPKLLDYSVASDGSLLTKGKLRAAVKVERRGDDVAVGVVTFREGAAFQTAPLTPYAP